MFRRLSVDVFKTISLGRGSSNLSLLPVQQIAELYALRFETLNILPNNFLFTSSTQRFQRGNSTPSNIHFNLASNILLSSIQLGGRIINRYVVDVIESTKYVPVNNF